MVDFLDTNGNFLVHIHQPSYRVTNLRRHDQREILGLRPSPNPEADKPPDSPTSHLQTEADFVYNQENFPLDDLVVEGADPVYEIPNPFSFRGSSYISPSRAETRVERPEAIKLPSPPPVTLASLLQSPAPKGEDLPLGRTLGLLPRPLLLTLAATGTEPSELAALAALSCELLFPSKSAENSALTRKISEASDPNAGPLALLYTPEGKPVVHDHDLYETVANNPHLPAPYREIMVLRPGAQGSSEIVGEYGGKGEETHIYEYLRRNSYIPWGHYAANMADDAIRYRISELSSTDFTGLRHLYYQRTFLRLAEMFELPLQLRRRGLSPDELETLRRKVLEALKNAESDTLPFTAILWGWNFGYDISGSGFKLHASHQQIHQQYALIPPPPAFACGDQIARCCRDFRQSHGRGLFTALLAALRNNRRTDQRLGRPARLIIHEDDQVVLFVPKAQVSQWELQIAAKHPVGNILEADRDCRDSLDRALLLAQRILAALGATMVTSSEYNKRLTDPNPDQHLLYILQPKLPWSMGAFSESQQRWICGHYPEDFAAACRKAAQAL